MVGPGEAVTENLTCSRPGVSVADLADDYESLFTDPAVERWLRPEPMKPFSRVELEAMARRDQVHWVQHGYGPWVVRERESGAFVGRGGLAKARVDGTIQVELPWAVMPELQGQGYATEMALAALETARSLELDRVVSLTLVTNVASWRVMEKAGMERVGEIEHVGLPHLLYVMDL